MVYAIQVCWQLASRIRMSIVRSFPPYTQQGYTPYRFADSSRAGSGWNQVPSWSWKTHDNRERNCPKHVEFHSKKTFEKLVHLVGFIIRKSKLIFNKLLFESMHRIQHTQSVTLLLEVIITEHSYRLCLICVKRSLSVRLNVCNNSGTYERGFITCSTKEYLENFQLNQPTRCSNFSSLLLFI
jgi:hypothetical protein